MIGHIDAFHNLMVLSKLDDIINCLFSTKKNCKPEI